MCKLVELDTGAVQKIGKTRRELSILWSSNYWFICSAVSHGFDVDLLIVVALEGHLGMNCLLVVADPSLWVTQIAFQQDVGHPQVELIRGVVPAQKIYISEWTSNKALHPFKNNFSTYHIFWYRNKKTYSLFVGWHSSSANVWSKLTWELGSLFCSCSWPRSMQRGRWRCRRRGRWGCARPRGGRGNPRLPTCNQIRFEFFQNLVNIKFYKKSNKLNNFRS